MSLPVVRHGFTLLEMLITLAVIGILSALAYPSYRDHVLRARRSEAFGTLSAVAQAQDRWRAKHTEYASSLADLGIDATSKPGRYYLIEIQPHESLNHTHFTAIARATGTQRADTRCALLRLGQHGKQQIRTASDHLGNDTSQHCWPS
jgi:type IV pilus assembly protein PilE